MVMVMVRSPGESRGLWPSKLSKQISTKLKTIWLSVQFVAPGRNDSVDNFLPIPAWSGHYLQARRIIDVAPWPQIGNDDPLTGLV